MSGVAARRSFLRVVQVVEVAGVEGVVAARELPDASGADRRSRGAANDKKNRVSGNFRGSGVGANVGRFCCKLDRVLPCWARRPGPSPPLFGGAWFNNLGPLPLSGTVSQGSGGAEPGASDVRCTSWTAVGICRLTPYNCRVRSYMHPNAMRLQLELSTGRDLTECRRLTTPLLHSLSAVCCICGLPLSSVHPAAGNTDGSSDLTYRPIYMTTTPRSTSPGSTSPRNTTTPRSRSSQHRVVVLRGPAF